MKHQKRWLAGLLALLVAVSCFGCGKGTAESPAESPKEENTTETAITVTDMSGREITLEEPAARVVALTTADCEILYAIGAGDTLVGREATVITLPRCWMCPVCNRATTPISNRSLPCSLKF